MNFNFFFYFYTYIIYLFVLMELSIGSLGSGNSKAYVSGVTVDGAKLSGTTNGVRIKTWQASATLSIIYKI